MKNISKISNPLLLVLGFFYFFLLLGCAAMDLRVDTLPTSSDFGRLSPRVSMDKCVYYTKDNAPDPSYYTVLASYIVQEEPMVIIAKSAQDMIRYIHKKAVKMGADTIIVDEITTTSVAGDVARTSPIVKVRAIRFKGELPKDFN